MKITIVPKFEVQRRTLSLNVTKRSTSKAKVLYYLDSIVTVNQASSSGLVNGGFLRILKECFLETREEGKITYLIAIS